MITIYLKGHIQGKKQQQIAHIHSLILFTFKLCTYIFVSKNKTSAFLSDNFTFLHKKHDFKLNLRSKEKLTIFSCIVFIQIYFQTSGKNRVSKHKLFVRFFAVVTAFRSAFKCFTTTNNMMYRRV